MEWCGFAPILFVLSPVTADLLVVTDPLYWQISIFL